MCTLTWQLLENESYEIFFNRDESKGREPALPPSAAERKGIRYLAPVDPRGGGSWIMGNEFGIVVSLLNWYEKETPASPPEGWRSRGKIVLGLADVIDQEELSQRIARIDGRNYPPFRLVAFVPGEAGGVEVLGWEWKSRGAPERMADLARPVCSSSFEVKRVIEGRRQRWEALLAEAGGQEGSALLHHFHHGGLPGGRREPPDAYSIRVNRPDAQTWSISHIRVCSDEVRFSYEAETPGLEGAARESLYRLPRHRPTSESRGR